MDIYFDAVIPGSWLHPIPYQFCLCLLLTSTKMSLVPFSPCWAKLSGLFSFPLLSPTFANLPILASSSLIVQFTVKKSPIKMSSQTRSCIRYQTGRLIQGQLLGHRLKGRFLGWQNQPSFEFLLLLHQNFNSFTWMLFRDCGSKVLALKGLHFFPLARKMDRFI